MTVKIRCVPYPTAAEIDSAVAITAIAFNNDNWTLSAVGGDVDLVDSFFRARYMAGSIAGRVYLASCTMEDGTEKDVGVALWYGPGIEQFDSAEQRRLGYDGVLEKLNPTSRVWFEQTFVPELSGLVGTIRRDTWHLQLLAVLAEFRKQGIAKALVTPIQDQARQEGSKTSVVTQNILNVPMYNRLGYERKSEVTIPGGILGDLQMTFLCEREESS